MRKSLLLLVACGVAFTTRASEKITLKAADGLEITGDLYIVNDNAPYILLCHQAGYSRGEYVVTAERFNKLGYNCLAIDQRSGNSVNNIPNETYQRAKAKNLPTEYLDAEQDIVAGIDYLYERSHQPITLLGSSYSASLALTIAAKNDKVGAVIAFSPGEYFGTKLNVKESIKGLNKPTFVASSKAEGAAVKELISDIPADKKQQFYPGLEGIHGSRALWKSCESNQEYWLSLIRFLSNIKKENNG
ncbi:MAG: hypothetical protein KDD36_14910 [Flavobacteriales bacterium]|nr:hypothetical protein [Flavobacteriales bacterium]